MTQADLRKGQQGFTLVELLVAFTLLGMLLGVMYGGLNIGAKTSTAVSRLASESQANAAGRAFLRESIENAMAFPLDNTQFDDDMQVERVVGFSGGNDWLRFVTEITAPNGERQAMVMELAHDTRNSALVLKYNRNEPVRLAWQKPLTEVATVAHDVVAVAIEYRSQGTEAGEFWLPDWNTRADMPQLVRITVRTKDRAWPDLLLQPRSFLDARLAANAF